MSILRRCILHYQDNSYKLIEYKKRALPEKWGKNLLLENHWGWGGGGGGVHIAMPLSS